MVPRSILVITTGGTIAGQVATGDGRISGNGKPPDSVAGGLLSVLSPTLSHISEQWAVDIQLDMTCVLDLDSSDIGPSHWMMLIDVVAQHYDRYDGFLITHGTNTMGYTAAAMSFALANLGKPVVITGSQVPFGWPGSDAQMNLENAVRVAAWPYDGGIRGVVVVFGSYIITGTRAKKVTEFDYDAFQSFSTPSLGRIGRIINVNVINLQRHHAYLSQARPEALRSRDLDIKNKFDGRLFSFTEIPGLEPKAFKDLVMSLIDRPDDSRLKGVVLRAFGAGDVSNDLHPCLEFLKESQVPVIVTTQAPNGNSNFLVNNLGLKLAKNRLAVPAYDMSIESITTKLMWLLGQKVSYNEMQDRFLEDLHGEITRIIERY